MMVSKDLFDLLFLCDLISYYFPLGSPGSTGRLAVFEHAMYVLTSGSLFWLFPPLKVFS